MQDTDREGAEKNPRGEERQQAASWTLGESHTHKNLKKYSEKSLGTSERNGDQPILRYSAFLLSPTS